MEYNKRYKALNDAQRLAVDTIEGPVMVIAGPGTGKTELLSVRTATILQKTDTLPENILCLTFTDSGAAAMRERLTGLLGKDAYKVAVHTFHSFGSEVINQNGQYFYQGAHFRPADELSMYEIMRTIFEQLDYRSPIGAKLNDDYTYLSDSLTVISEMKKSGLTSDEIILILDANDAVIEKAHQLLTPIFADKISKKTAEQAAKHIDAIKKSGVHIQLPGIVSLADVIADSLQLATDQAINDNSTKPITAWRNTWFKKNEKSEFVLKSAERQIKLRALTSVYEQYLARMQEAELYDFDDMILRVVHALEVFDDLRFNLQEKYQYIMVDEFQDTNLAQMRILYNLTNNPVQGDTPNILVVGDDDQAIYSFQGADISNIFSFRSLYPKVTRITLTDNYRSTATVLSHARAIITQGVNRLEMTEPDLNKQLTAHLADKESRVTLHEAESTNDEREWLVHSIADDIKAGIKPSDIAVFTRRHHEIVSLLPYFSHAGIAVNYERRHNVLDQPPMICIEQLSHLLLAINDGRHNEANGLLAEVLAHPMWGISPSSLWKLSLRAYERHTMWLEVMATSPEFTPLYSWLVATATMAHHAPLEQMLDIIIGKTTAVVDDPLSEQSDPFIEPTLSSDFVSPVFNYFFADSVLASRPDEYLTYLEGLRTIRSKLREYSPAETPTLASFIEFISLHRQMGSPITSVRAITNTEDAVNLMTAHRSKGLEFDHIYILGAIDNVWGERARSRSRLIRYPENLVLAPAGETADERLRLFYVALTRAKRHAHISYSLHDDNGKNTLRASFLLSDDWSVQPITHDVSLVQRTQAAEIAWYQRVVPPSTTSLRQLLAGQLDNYKLSVTHMHNFLDVSRGGPATFLLHNLLRFPQAMSPNAAYGSAVHNALQRAHAHFSAHGQPQAIEDVVRNFESSLEIMHLPEHEFETFLQKGSDALQTFLTARYDSFSPTQKVELGFGGQHSFIGEAHLTGSLDVVDIAPDKTVVVTDYKTGHPSLLWNGKTEYEKIKLHKYKQQLLFYKLLLEHARDYRGYTVTQGILQFVEPTKAGDIISLEMAFDDEEVARFSQLIEVVWAKIITLELPDISKYEPSLKGILAFEQDLLDKAI